jgi:hypothetical protein
MANVAKLGWHRREYVTNPADPTQVVVWRFHFGPIDLKMVGSWGIEANLWIGKFRYWSYDAWWAKYLFGMLEDNFISQWHEEYDYDVAQAERRAGWDPNP